MKHLRFILSCFAAVAVSCTEERTDFIRSESTQGELSVVLSASGVTGAAETKTGTTAMVQEELMPVLDDFEVEVYTVPQGVRLYRDSYKNTVSKVIRLNTGDYRLLAQHGDSLGCGFAKPYFVADAFFTLTPDEPKKSIAATASLGNVMIDVKYDESVNVYYDWYVKVKHNVHTKKYVKFSRTETRPAFLPGGDITLEFYAQVDEEGTWKYAKIENLSYEPNDYVTFNISTDPRESKLTFNILVDGTEEVIEKEFGLPSWVTPQDAPSIYLSGFDENNRCRIIEGVPVGKGGTISIHARAALANCFLSVKSDLLASKGFPTEEIDLANADAALIRQLKGAGFIWDENMLGTRELTYISLEEVMSYLNGFATAAKEEKTVADFTLRVVDEVAKETTVTFSIATAPINPVMTIDDCNIWATKVVGPKVTVSDGANKNLFKLQMRKAGSSSWTNLDNKIAGTGLTMTAEDVTGLTPGAQYQLRVIYNDNLNVVSDALTFNTEKAEQIANSGFEDFVKAEYKFTTKSGILSSTETREWYLPYANLNQTDKWWAVNSKKTMPALTEPNNLYYKVFPTCSYVTLGAYSGTKSAQIATVYVNSKATATSDGDGTAAKAVGELFIGTVDDNGQTTSYGHSFASRPQALKFMYRYDPVGNESFYVQIDILDENDGVIATNAQRVTEAAVTGRWTECIIPLDYYTSQSKAKKIFVTFKSSSKTDSGAGYNSGGSGTIEMAGSTYTARFGSILKVDDLELLYY